MYTPAGTGLDDGEILDTETDVSPQPWVCVTTAVIKTFGTVKYLVKLHGRGKCISPGLIRLHIVKFSLPMLLLTRTQAIRKRLLLKVVPEHRNVTSVAGCFFYILSFATYLFK